MRPMKMLSVTVAIVAAVVVLRATLASPLQAQAGARVFEGARLIVGDGSAPIEDSAFVVQGNRITAVGRRGQVNAPAGAQRVDLTGKTVMPAIVDTHTHLSQAKDALSSDLRRRPYYGVSAAMSLGQDLADAMSMRGQPQPGLARFFSAGLGITGLEKGRMTSAIQVTTPAEARAAVQKVAATKPDVIKIWIDDRMGTVVKLAPDLYAAVIDEAHRSKLRVTAHIFALEDAKGATKAGLDAYAHVPARDKDVDDEFMAILKARNPSTVWLVPNLPNRGVRMDLSWLKDSLPAAELQKLEMGNTDNAQAQQAFGIQARNLKKMSDAGVRVILGTDGNTAWQPHVEMADMVASGLTPMQVIVASTRNGAEFLRMADAGTIAADKSADFIVLDANPLDDITNTRKINRVFLRGDEVNRAVSTQ
ncbi:MAG: amidohydrolase family protein [Acidimicrobiia bacterium]|nr:amidohydrolase family protein [Acidimicrobiia bacterium]